MWCPNQNPNPPDVRELLSRRGFLRAGSTVTLAGAVTALGGRAAWAEACDGVMGSVPVSQRSIQLYTMIPLINVDAGLTLQQLYGIGYRRVEHAGFGSAGNAAAFRAACDGAGPEKIACSSGHQGIGYPYDAASFEVTLADALAIGQKFIISPSTNASTQHDWMGYAKALNAAGARATAAGLAGVGHHNHTGEYTAFSGTKLMPIDILMAETDPSVVTMEMDLCWVWSAKADPVQFLEKYPHRYRQFHVKDMNQAGQPTFPGLGLIDFNRIFEAAARTQVIEEYIIEQDSSPAPLYTAQRGWDLMAAATFACPEPAAVTPPVHPMRPPRAPVPAPEISGSGGALAATGASGSAALLGLATLAVSAVLRRRLAGQVER
jgi:sugar phosphate isomerase/epimerase